MPDTYRQAASVLVLRPVQGGHQVLLVHKPRKRDAWQLPQGGMEQGETLEQAALRELREEASLTGVRVLAASKEVYRYDFPASYRRFRPDTIKGQSIGFVIALAPADAVVTVDQKEIDDFVWVDPKHVGTKIKRQAYAQLIQRLVAEAHALL